MTIQELLIKGSERLSKARVPDAALDARFLLLETFDLSLASFLAKRNQKLSEDEATAEMCRVYEELIEKRASRIPLQQLTGVQEFMGFNFRVNEHVLIPRQDTETLVELVLQEKKDTDQALLDVCTGSGCIAVSLALLGGFLKTTALDLSKEALKVAKANKEALLENWPGTFELLESDMFEHVPEDSVYDVIVSNPPYIPSAVIEELEPEVREHEPRMALDGTEDGLKFYRILAKHSKRHLKPQGRIYMEIGYDQAEAVMKLFSEQGYRELKAVKDMAGHDRVIRGLWPGVFDR